MAKKQNSIEVAEEYMDIVRFRSKKKIYRAYIKRYNKTSN